MVVVAVEVIMMLMLVLEMEFLEVLVVALQTPTIMAQDLVEREINR
jgi:hypothetical protein